MSRGKKLTKKVAKEVVAREILAILANEGPDESAKHILRDMGYDVGEPMPGDWALLKPHARSKMPEGAIPEWEHPAAAMLAEAYEWLIQRVRKCAKDES